MSQVSVVTGGAGGMGLATAKIVGRPRDGAHAGQAAHLLPENLIPAAQFPLALQDAAAAGAMVTNAGVVASMRERARSTAGIG